MGDFNDTPDDPSIKDILCKDKSLINLFAENKKLGFGGTLKHQYNWQIFDQIIVSNSLYINKEGLVYKPNSAQIFHADFLFEKDETYGGAKLFRTYVGPKYYGGYSDHLPVYIDLIFKWLTAFADVFEITETAVFRVFSLSERYVFIEKLV